MRVDLHAHTIASDGTQSPTELVLAAVAARLDVLGITDHDTTDSWPEAAQAAEAAGLTLVRGIEVSTVHRGRGVHLLAYLPDPTHPGLDAALRVVREGRRARVPRILSRLHELGVEITEDDVRRVSAGTSATGRPHVADALISRGVVHSRSEAFARFLNPGRPAYVQRTAPELVDAIGVVAQAGGVSVLAHPWGRSARSVLQAEAIEELRDAGLVGLEADHQDHDQEARAELAGIAGELDLVVTGSSDHHGLGKVGHELGCHTTVPEQYERLLDEASRAAERSGRTTPSPLAP